jgi:hypothetical protein
MWVGWMLLLVCAAGCVGGLVNGFLTDQGLTWPRFVEGATNETRIWQPGFLGNVVIGAVAAGISWMIYGPLAGADVLAAVPAGTALTFSSLGGGAVVGAGGAKWLASEVDKKLLKAAATVAAGKNADANRAQAMVTASPTEVLTLAKAMAG